VSTKQGAAAALLSAAGGSGAKRGRPEAERAASAASAAAIFSASLRFALVKRVSERERETRRRDTAPFRCFLLSPLTLVPLPLIFSRSAAVARALVVALF
jgi:hypothetical protein